MSELIEAAYKNLELLTDWYEQNIANRNEATTRSQLIDRLFYDCLAWDRMDITSEDAQGGQYTDYIFHLTRKIMIAEAKREGDYFDIPIDWQGKLYNIKTLTRGNKNLDSAIQQVTHYCALHGVSYAMVTNGHQIVVFVGISNVPLYERKALVFSSLARMKEEFQTFWQTLSKPAFSTNKLNELLQGKSERQLPLKLSAKIPNYPKSQIRNQLQADLQILSELILEDIVHTEEHEKEFLEECYCPSGALSQFSLLSKDILEKRYYSLYPDEGNGPVTQPATTKKGISNDLLAETYSRRPILIIGDVGVGKTTFIKKLIKVDAPEIFDASIWIYVDFGRQATLTESIKNFFLDEVSEQLKEQYGFDIYNREFVKRVY